MTAAAWQLPTLAVRAGQERSQFGEHGEALYLTSSFVFENAAQAARRFSGEEAGNVYSRFSNPTVSAFEQRLAALEGAEACVATASGMSAIMALVLAHLKQGDHIVTANSLFGATVQLFANILSRTGITTSFVSPTDPAAWAAAIRPETKLFFLETPSNPLTEIADIRALTAIAHAQGILVAVDNCFCTPILQRPLELGADLVVHSATKYIDGQGRVLGGAVCGAKRLTEEVFKYLRTAGPTLSAFNAWVLLQGTETLSLRVDRHVENTKKVVEFLAGDSHVAKVNHPSLPEHPDHELYQKSFPNGGASILTLEIKCGQEAAWKFIDHLQVFSLLANVADVKSLVVHPATTTHSQLSAEELAEQNITPSTIRLSIGTENAKDIIWDLKQAFAALDE